jgi:hypothetical protein
VARVGQVAGGPVGGGRQGRLWRDPGDLDDAAATVAGDQVPAARRLRGGCSGAEQRALAGIAGEDQAGAAAVADPLVEGLERASGRAVDRSGEQHMEADVAAQGDEVEEWVERVVSGGGDQVIVVDDQQVARAIAAPGPARRR